MWIFCISLQVANASNIKYTGLESDFQAKNLAATLAGMLALGSSSTAFSLSYTRSYMTEKEQIANIIL